MVRTSRTSETLGPHLHPPEMGRQAQKGARLAQGNIGCKVQSQGSKEKLTSGALWEPTDTPSLPTKLLLEHARNHVQNFTDSGFWPSGVRKALAFRQLTTLLEPPFLCM